MNVTVLIVCTVLSCADVSGEFSRFFLVFCYLLHMQCIGNTMCHCATKIQSQKSLVYAARTKIELKLLLVPKKLYCIKTKITDKMGTLNPAHSPTLRRYLNTSISISVFQQYINTDVNCSIWNSI